MCVFNYICCARVSHYSICDSCDGGIIIIIKLLITVPIYDLPLGNNTRLQCAVTLRIAVIIIIIAIVLKRTNKIGNQEIILCMAIIYTFCSYVSCFQMGDV